MSFEKFRKFFDWKKVKRVEAEMLRAGVQLAKNRAVSETAKKPAAAVNLQNGLGIEFRNEHSMFRDFGEFD